MKLVVTHLVDGEHVGQFDICLEPKLDVVAEQERVTDTDDVAWYTIVFGRNSMRREQSSFDVAENVRA